MKAKLAIASLIAIGAVVLCHAYIRSYAPFSSQFVQTCENALKQRLTVPSAYLRIGVDETRRTLGWDEFFAEPERSVSEATRNAMINAARVPPVQYVALIDYQAQDSIGAIIRESATCTFNSLDGSDAPSRTYWVKINGEHNMQWAARQPNAGALQLRLWKQQ